MYGGLYERLRYFLYEGLRCFPLTKVVYEAVFEVFEMLPLAALVGGQVRGGKCLGL